MVFTTNKVLSDLSSILLNIGKLLLLIFVYDICNKCLRQIANLFEKVFGALVLFKMNQYNQA